MYEKYIIIICNTCTNQILDNGNKVITYFYITYEMYEYYTIINFEEEV